MESFESGLKVIWDAMNDRVLSDSSRFKCLLFILHLYQNRTFREKLAGTDGKTCFAERLERAVQDTVQADVTGQSGYLKEIFEVYKKYFDGNYFDECQTDPRVWDRFLEAVSSVPDEWYAEYYKEAFETILARIVEGENREYGSFIQPAAVTRLVADLLGYEGKGSVYNPYAGLASYAVEMNVLSDYHGEERNQETRALGMLRLAAHGIDPESLSVKDSYMQGFDGDCKYDYVVATPPFSGLIRKGDKGFDPDKYHTYYRDFLFRGSKMLSTNGKLAGVFPLSFIYSEQGEPRELRKYLVTNHLVSTVILLPNAIFFNTSFPTVVVILDGAKKGEGVKFIDASTLYEKVRHRSVLDLDKIKEAIGCEDGVHTKVVSYEYVANPNQGGYSLYPSMYIDEGESRPEGYIAVKASDVLNRIIKKSREDTRGIRGHMLTPKDLPDMAFANPISASDLPEQDIPEDARSVSRSCVFITRFTPLRPTYVSVQEGETLYYGPNLEALIYDDTPTVYRPLFLYEWARKANKLVTAATMLRVDLDEACMLDVFLPGTVSEQKALYERMLREFKDARAKELGLENVIAAQREDYMRTLHFRKHDLGNSLAAVSLNVRVLSKFLSDQKLYDMPVNPHYPLTVGQQMEDLIRLLKQMNDNISGLLDEEPFGRPEKIDLVARLEAIPDGGDYTVKVTKDFDEKQAFASINAGDLNKVIENIIGNAVKHGFKGGSGHKVVVDLSYDAKDRKYVIAFKNDGIPMPDGFDTIRYGTVGDKSVDSNGSGQGGAIVKGIVEHFGGSVEVVNDPDAVYPVEIIIKLPIYDGK